jgi:hypothetical protein
MNAAARARAYLDKLPPAIAGSGGHAATYAAACEVVEFGANEAEALEILSAWNQTHCQPAWSERDLRHKLASAFRHTAPAPHLISAVSARNGAPSRRLSLPSPAVRRPALPTLRPGTVAEFSRLAELRGMSREGVAAASEKGLLRFGEHRGQAAWFILDTSGRVAQARRVDGQPWAPGVKAWTLAGSQAAWPVGIAEAAPFPVVAFCEGGPDLLAALHFIRGGSRERDVAPVTMPGGCARIHADALPQFAGKRVRIFPHVDDTGADAVNRWAEQLASVGADVDAFSFAGLRRADGQPVKDFCDLAAIHADDFEANRCLWTLFPDERTT